MNSAFAPLTIDLPGAISRWEALATETALAVVEEIEAHEANLVLAVPPAPTHQGASVLSFALCGHAQLAVNMSFRDITLGGARECDAYLFT